MTTTARALVLDFVRKYPAIHVREVERRLGLPDRLGAYHLRRLERDGLVRSTRDHGFLRYWPAKTLRLRPSKDARRLHLLRRDHPSQIAVLLAASGESSPTHLAAALGIAKATASYHLGRMSKAGLVSDRTEGRNRLYRLTDPAWTLRMLRDLPPLPGVRDEFRDMWDDLVG